VVSCHPADTRKLGPQQEKTGARWLVHSSARIPCRAARCGWWMVMGLRGFGDGLMANDVVACRLKIDSHVCAASSDRSSNHACS
jgi:hypothetical protein